MISENQSLRRYNHLMSEIDSVYHRMSVSLGLTDSTSQILYTLLCENGAAPLTHIASLTGMSRQTLHSALQKLQREGCLVLEAVDGKSKQARLTKCGEAYAGETAAKIMKAENTVYDSWSEDDVRTYLALTDRFLRDLKHQADLIDHGTDMHSSDT